MNNELQIENSAHKTRQKQHQSRSLPPPEQPKQPNPLQYKEKHILIIHKKSQT